jgi:sigma-B regulation protein RsbU (phosphoserine phosphatase)
MSVTSEDLLHRQLLDRRDRLQTLARRGRTTYFEDLLREVDAALERMHDGSFGICEICHDTVEAERLLANPLCRVCLDHLSPGELRSLERDLELAGKVQSSLLPKPGATIDGWAVHAHYAPAGPVSGDYYDLLAGGEPGEAYVFFGDVSGKGVSASILMANLQAILRSQVTGATRPGELLERANRIFSECTLPSAFATLVCGRFLPSGRIELANAGHLPPLHLRSSGAREVPGTGLPLGLFPETRYEEVLVEAEPADLILFYTDGLTESRNATSEDYGIERVERVLAASRDLPPETMVTALLRDAEGFRQGRPAEDDLTILALRRD